MNPPETITRKFFLIFGIAIAIVLLFAPNIKAQWQQLTGPPSGPVNDFAEIDSSNGRIYAATNNGVYRTTNIAGAAPQWQLMGLANREVLKITQYQIYGQEILLAIVRIGSPWQLCRSSDSAKTWDTLFTSTSQILEIVQDGKDIVTGVAGSSTDTTAGIFRSSNLGDTWSHQAPGPPNRNLLTDFTLGGGKIVGIVADSNYGNEGIWSMASTGTAWEQTTYPYWHGAQSLKYVGAELFVGGVGRIDISTDNGTDWLPLTNNGLDTTKDYFSSFAANGINIVAAGPYGAYLTTDGGRDWQHIEGTGGYPRNDGIGAMDFLDNQFFAGSYAGLVVSPDGITWKYAADGITGEILDVISNDTLLFALTPRGVFRSPDQGTTWIAPNGGSDLQDSLATSLYNLGGEIYATGPGLVLPSTGIAFSTGLWRWNGSGWTTLTDIPAVSIADDSGLLFASLGIDGLEESTDNGSSWIDASNGLPFDTSSTDAVVALGGTLLAFQSPPGALFFDKLERVYASDDKGNSWSFLDTLPHRGFVSSVATANGNVYVASTTGGLSSSSDGGEYWANSAQIDRQLRTFGSSGVIVTTNDSIYSMDTSEVSIFSDSLAGSPIGFTSDKQYAYAATDSRGIWAAPLKSLPLSVPNTASAHPNATIQVYPNPCDNSTNISFSLPDREHISIRLFDERGVCQAILFEGSAGPAETILPVSIALPAGAYEAQLSGSQGISSILIIIQNAAIR